VMEVLKQAAREGKAVVAVLHDLTLAARFCDRLLLLYGGAVLADGSPLSVLRERNLELAYSVAFVRGRHAEQEFIVAWDRQSTDHAQ
jgi:iron complex transport system ATP-binding protein